MASDPAGIIDAHVHLWQRGRTPQDWIDPDSMAAIDRDFWFDDLDSVLTRHGVGAAVIVQASNSDQETEDLLTADLPESVGAIVGWVDLESPSAGDRIEELRGLANGSKLVGIRHLAHIDADPLWLARSSVSRGFDTLEHSGLSFDLVITREQLGTAARVVADHPGVSFILDHLAKPDLRSRDLADWERDLRALAALPNVRAKMSGLTMEADWNNWNSDDLKRSVDVALEAFGPHRLMFGSDWPLVEVCGGYGAWLEAARTLLSGVAEIDQRAVFSDTARSTYRIGGPGRG